MGLVATRGGVLVGFRLDKIKENVDMPDPRSLLTRPRSGAGGKSCGRPLPSRIGLELFHCRL